MLPSASRAMLPWQVGPVTFSSSDAFRQVAPASSDCAIAWLRSTLWLQENNKRRPLFSTFPTFVPSLSW